MVDLFIIFFTSIQSINIFSIITRPFSSPQHFQLIVFIYGLKMFHFGSFSSICDFSLAAGSFIPVKKLCYPLYTLQQMANMVKHSAVKEPHIFS